MQNHNTLFALSFLLSLGAAPGCGDGAPSGPDGGNVNARLEILSPPGDAIGLAYGGRVTLRVRYVSELGQPIPGALVEFTLLATGAGESAAGSTLSAAAVTSDAQGLAQVDLVAGSQNATFRVRVDARDALTQHFYISISNGGFARLYITPVHEGWRDPDALERVEVRLFRPELLRCAALDIDELPDSLLPPRRLGDGFGGTVDYQNVSAGEPHTVVAWSLAPGGEVPLGVGCVDLGAGQLPNSRVNLDLPVRDRDLVLGQAELTASFDLGPVAAELEARGLLRPWQILGCDAGPGQLVLDCALDALAPDGALDCVVGGAGPILAAVAALRGPVDAGGCRPATRDGGLSSLDAELSLAMSGAFPQGEELDALLAVRAHITAGFELDSELALLAEPTGTRAAARHRLRELRVIVNGDAPESALVYALDLAATSRPVVEQQPVGVLLAGNRLSVDEHGFTLRYGAFAAQAFTALGLEPAGLAGQGHALGTALSGSLSAGSDTGCVALSALVCDAIEESAACLRDACIQGALALDELMLAWWQALSGPGLDFSLSGSAELHDLDGDRRVDRVGGDTPGQGMDLTGQGLDETWSATLRLQDGTPVSVPGAL